MPKILKQGYTKVKLDKNTEGITQETLAKLKIIAKMIAKGKSRLTCIDYIQDTWGYSDTHANRLYATTLQYLKVENDEGEADKMRTKLITLLESQIEDLNARDSVEARKAAQSAADLIAKLNSLYTDKKEVKVEGDITFEFGTPEAQDEV